MRDDRGEGRRGVHSMSGPPPCPSDPPMQHPPTAFTVSYPLLPINYFSSPKSPPSLAYPSSSASTSASASASALALASASASSSASNLCICTPYVAVDVLLIPFLSVIEILRSPCNYFHHPCPFSSLVMSFMTCVHFVPEATERLVQRKKSGWKTLFPRTIDAELVRKAEDDGLFLFPVCM